MIPRHVALIPDGNRRCARRLMKRPWLGHRWGVQKIKDVMEWCKELGIKYVTFYTLSIENLEKRPKRETDFLFSLARKEIKDILKDKNSFVHKNKVRVGFFGRIEKLPEDLQRDILELAETTKKYSGFCLNFAIAYGGRQEILDACRKIGRAVSQGKLRPEQIDEAVFRQSLYTNGVPDPDLIIRTSEQRLSGFLLWQSAYSEIAFLDTYWPDMTKKEFFQVIKEFGKRERRFGK